MDRVINLEPQTLFSGHDVFRGADEIRATMTKDRDATACLRDGTKDGMDSGADLTGVASDRSRHHLDTARLRRAPHRISVNDVEADLATLWANGMSLEVKS